MNESNPFTASRNEAERVAEALRLEEGYVVSVPEGSSVPPAVEVMTYGPDGGSTIASVAMTLTGDMNVPPVGSDVILAERKGGRPVVLACSYEEMGDIPSAKVDERVISHSSSHAEIRLKPDGSVHVTNDSGTSLVLDGGTVTINGGTQGVITDVSTSKDGDGHVTDVSITRNQNILI